MGKDDCCESDWQISVKGKGILHSCDQCYDEIRTPLMPQG